MDRGEGIQLDYLQSFNGYKQMIVGSPLRTMRILLVVDIALIALAIVYAITQSTPDTATSIGSFTMVLAGSGLVARVVGWIGLWFDKNWGLVAFALSAALFVVTQEPDTTETRLSLVLDNLGTLTGGIILGLAFFGFPNGFARSSRRAIGDTFS